jgi:ATP-dependent DNA helicase RecG
MIARCRAAGLAAPVFRQSGGQFVQTVGRIDRWVDLGGTPQVTPQVDPEILLLQVLTGEMSRRELQAAMGLKDVGHFRNAILAPAIAAGLVEMTIPDSPNSRLQKYRRTAKGERRLRRGK